MENEDRLPLVNFKIEDSIFLLSSYDGDKVLFDEGDIVMVHLKQDRMTLILTGSVILNITGDVELLRELFDLIYVGEIDIEED